MRMARCQRTTVSCFVLAALLLHLGGCGYLLHPERRGMPHSNRIDPAVVLLDGLGCLCFLVPGVIAFAVDFSTGTIYLPHDHSGAYGGTTPAPSGTQLAAIPLKQGERHAAGIEKVIERETGRRIELAGPDTVIRNMESPDDFDSTVRNVAHQELQTRP